MLDGFGPLEAIREFIERGGDVLYLILIVLLAMWTLIIERFWYFWRVYPQQAVHLQSRWEERSDFRSWNAHRIREALISGATLDLKKGLVTIKTLVALCPLLGLLGTVTGMIEVFNVMAFAGSSNARAMAAGVSKATIPTMAGMVAALSGLMISIKLEEYASQESEKLADHLTIQHE